MFEIEKASGEYTIKSWGVTEAPLGIDGGNVAGNKYKEFTTKGDQKSS